MKIGDNLYVELTKLLDHMSDKYRYALKTKAVPLDEDRMMITFTAYDNLLKKEVYFPESQSELIKTVCLMNEEDKFYNKSVNEYINNVGNKETIHTQKEQQ